MLTEQEYLNDPRCPFCHSNEIDFEEFEEFDFIRKGFCLKCDFSWTEGFEVVSVEWK